jgi:hypothetical protein
MLYRATVCGLCRRALGDDRWLFRDFRPLRQQDPATTPLLVAHPACVAERNAAAVVASAREREAMMRVMARIANEVELARRARRAGLVVPWL